MRYIFFSIVVLLVFSCRPISVTTQADEAADLGDYISFNWISGLFNDISDGKNYVNQQALRIIQTKVMKEMILKGFRFETEDPEVLVNIVVVKEEGEPANTFEHDFAYWRGYEAPQNIQPGSLIIELIDAGSKKVVWQGIANDALPGQPNESRIDLIVSQIFSAYENRII